MHVRVCLFSILFVCCFSSCSVLTQGDKGLKPLASQPLVATVGVFQSGNFIETGVPRLDEKIRLSFRKIPFSKTTIKKHNQKVLQEEEKLEITDSLDVRPYYHRIEIADKVGLITALNSPENTNLRTLLESTEKKMIVTSLEIFFPPEIARLIEEASEVYLVNNKKSSYSLELLNKDRSRNVIDFKEGVSFGYGFFGFCWRENNRRQPEVAGFRKKGDSCPGDTNKNPKKLKGEDLFERL